MLAWKLNFNWGITMAFFFAFLGARMATIQYFVTVAVTLTVNFRIFETRHIFFVTTRKELTADNFAIPCAWPATNIITSVFTVLESFLALYLTDNLPRVYITLYCLLVTALRNCFHHGALTKTFIGMMALLLTLMLVRTGSQTLLLTKTAFMIVICRVARPIASMATIQTLPTDLAAASKWKVLEVISVFCFVDIVVPLANKCQGLTDRVLCFQIVAYFFPEWALASE